MTTLAELVDTPPLASSGVVTQINSGTGTWRWVVELADPSAGSSVEWHDLTGPWTGHDLQLGADEYAGRYRAGVVTLSFEVPDDRLAPWNEDTSATFGTHVALGAGLLVRGSLIRVADDTVLEWRPRYTMRVESWSDASRARGRIRQHTVVARDLITDLVGVPIIADLEANWYDRAQHVLTEAEWPFGSTIYGAQLTSGAADILTEPDVDDADDASQALDQALDPVGIVWHTNRKGQLIARPQPGDTFHADAFTAGATGDEWTDPATVVFSYNAELDGRLAYAVDDDLPPLGIDDTELYVVNHIRVTDPAGSYDTDDPVSIERYGRKSRKVSWVAANDDVADDTLTRLAYASKQATPITTTIDLPGFFPTAANLEYLTPTRLEYQTAAGRVVVTADGHTRQLIERMSPRGPGTINWEITTTFDVTATDTAAELNPVTGLTVTDLGYDDVTIGWTNPSQTITPTETWVRIPSISSLWIELPYPITAFAWLSLDPETTYTAEVRLVRRADGIITNVSPVRSVEFTTLEAPTAELDPDGGGGFVITLPDVDDPENCVIDWTLESSDDGTTFTLVDSGTAAGGATIPIDESELDPDLTYIVCVTEVCDAVEGTTYCSYFVVPACSTPPGYTAGDPPYDDPDLILFVPETCPPDRVVEAISGDQAARGPAFGGFFSVDTDDIALASSTAAAGVIAFDTADALDYSGSATIGCRVSVQNGEDVRLFSIAGLRIDCVDGTTGWYPRASVTTVNGDEVTVTDPTERALITPLELRASYDDETGILELAVNGTSVGTDSVEEAAPRASGNLWYVGAPAASWITDCAVWASVIAADAPAGHDGVAAWVAANSSDVLAYYPTDDAAADGTMSDESGNNRDGTYGANVGAGTIAGQTVADFLESPVEGRATVPYGSWMNSIVAGFAVIDADAIESPFEMLIVRDETALSTERSFQLRAAPGSEGKLQFVRRYGTNGTSGTTASDTNAFGAGSTIGFWLDGSTLRFYIDGVASDAVAIGGNYAASSADLIIGSWDGDDYAFDGRIGSIVLLDTADASTFAELHDAWTGGGP